MRDRWARRADPAPGERTLYCRVLMRDYPEVGELASEARRKLATFGGLHMTPRECLHMTTLVAGPADQFPDDQIRQMIEVAADQFAATPPIEARLGKILYHPEAIICAVAQAFALAPLRAAAVAALAQPGLT